MITFDYLTLRAFFEENQSFLTGARIQKIQQPTRRELIFSIRNLGETRKFYININPQFYHVAFMSKETEEQRGINIPQKPPMFCMLLRKYIENGIISKVKIPEYERILEFYIETYNELSEKIYLCLAIELMGKHSNIVLYNYDTNIIIGCAHNVGSEKSREREMAGTLPYVYPPKQNKTDILTYNGVFTANNLQERFLGFSKQLEEKCKNKSLEEVKSYFRLENICPHLADDKLNYSIFDDIDGYRLSTVNEVVDRYYANIIERNNIQTLKNTLISTVKPKIKKDKKAVQKIKYQNEKSKEGYKYRLYGDLIMANLYNNKDYSQNITVFDYENNEEITLSLDDTKTLKENANDFYKLYNKAKTTLEKSQEYLETVETNIKYLEQVEFSINIAKSYRELLEIKEEIIPTKTENNKKEKSSFEPEKREINGNIVYIGKNNRQNNHIVSKLAKDEDFWFHTKDCAGSHVLLKCKEPDEETILECAKLAKEFSSASKSSKTGVIYTRAKNLKKPPKSPLGYVTYKGEKEIIV